MQELTPELRELAIERVVNKMDRGHFWDGWWEYCGSDDQVRDHAENYMSDAELYEYVQDEIEQLEEAA